MKVQGALIKEHGVTFAIAIVKSHVLSDRSEAQRVIGLLQPAFGGVPTVLMAQNGRGVPTYYGRQDIVRFMAKVPLHAVPWREYSIG